MIKTYLNKKERQILDILEQKGIMGNASCHVYMKHEFFIDRIGELLPVLYCQKGTESLTLCLGHLMNNPEIIIEQIERQTQLIITLL